MIELDRMNFPTGFGKMNFPKFLERKNEKNLEKMSSGAKRFHPD